MRTLWRGLVALLCLLFALLYVAPTALADSYTDALAGKFNAATRVLADPAAKPPLQNADQLNRQILTSRWSWSSSPPVFVAAVAQNQTGITTPDALHNAMLGHDSKFGGVLLVIDSKGYHVRAYNVPQVVANSVDTFMGQAAKNHRNDPFGAATEFVSKLAGLNASGPATATSNTSNASHTSWTWLWVTLTIIGIILVLVLGGWFLVSRARKQREDDEAQREVQADLIDAESKVDDLNNAVLSSDVDVSSESVKAGSSLANARTAYKARDYTAGRAHIKAVNDAVAKANRKLNPPKASRLLYQDTPANPASYLPKQPKPDVDAVQSVPEGDRKQAKARVRNPDTGRTVTINNNNYSTTQRSGYDHYYGGGMYNGMYFYPGYYPYNYWGWGWSPTDVILADALLNDRWGGDYDRGYDAGRDSVQSDTSFSGGDTNDYDSQQSDTSFDGGSSSDSGTSDTSFDGDQDDSGGGDTDFSGGDSGGSDSGDSDTSYGGDTSYSSPSYDTPSYSSGDSGGGYDSSGGGYDSGGGYSDSGGGGSFDF